MGQISRSTESFLVFGDALVKQQTYITMNGINTVAPVTSVKRKRRQRLFRAWYTFQKPWTVSAHCRLQLRSCV